MEFTDDAKYRIENNLKNFFRRVMVGGRERTDFEKELRSTYYDAAEAVATTRGSAAVTVEDVNTAMANMGSSPETADYLMKSYASTLRKAGFWSRLAAYIIDNIAIWTAIFVLVLPLLICTVLFGGWPSDMIDKGSNPLATAVLVSIALVTAVSALFVYFGYYILLEGHFGFTIGKYLLGLRVLKADGTKVGYRESLLRNLSKYINNFIILDVLIMLIFFNKEKQRGFDKIASTVVVHVRG